MCRCLISLFADLVDLNRLQILNVLKLYTDIGEKMYTMYSLISLLNFRQEMLLAACIVGSEYIVVSALCRYICFRYINVLHLPDFS